MGFEVESIWAAMKGPHYERTISRLRESIRGAETLEEALSLALERVVLAAHAVTGTFWFYDKFGDGLIRAKAVFRGPDLSAVALRSGEGIAGQVIGDGRSVIVEDCQKDSRWANRVDTLTGFRTLSMLCVPLVWERHVFGCIQILNKTDDAFFDRTDLAFVEQLAMDTAGLFREQHLLDGYMDGLNTPVPPPTVVEEPSLFDLLDAETFEAVEERLRRSERFSQVRETEQKNILRHLREIWRIVQAGGAPGKKAKHGLFGR